MFITPNHYHTNEPETGKRSSLVTVPQQLAPPAPAAAVGWLAAWEPVWVAAVVLLAGRVFVSRDPERAVVAPPGAILSPADGRAIEDRWAASLAE